MNKVDILERKVKARKDKDIEKAIEFAKEIHEEDLREDGQPYIIHPLTVAHMCVERGMRKEAVIAALLHDVIEDHNVRDSEIEKSFGRAVAKLVILLTKPKLIGSEWVFPPDERYYSEPDEYTSQFYFERALVYYNKLINSGDIDAMIIKLFDNFHNIETIKAVGEARAKRSLQAVIRHSLILATTLFKEEEFAEVLNTLRRYEPRTDEILEEIKKAKANEGIVELNPRPLLDREMIMKAPLPGQRTISIYGNAKTATLMGYVEIGLPAYTTINAKQIAEIIGADELGLRVLRGRSLLPKSIAAHERIFIIEGFNTTLASGQYFTYDKTKRRIFFKDKNHNIIMSFPIENISDIYTGATPLGDNSKKFGIVKERLLKNMDRLMR